ncbi:MAG: hypothetical protein DJ555_03165 [Desulfurococcaceae archaeon]|nr:MAG: hypothetical protein DJ555_03165 [Desulfurococcaceae archaeon]
MVVVVTGGVVVVVVVVGVVVVVVVAVPPYLAMGSGSRLYLTSSLFSVTTSTPLMVLMVWRWNGSLKSLLIR